MCLVLPIKKSRVCHWILATLGLGKYIEKSLVN